MYINKTILLAVSFILTFLFFVKSSNATEWYMEPKISTQTGYNNNIRLDINTDDDASWMFFVSPEAKIGGHDLAWEIDVSAKVNFKRYFSLGNFDTNNLNMGMHAAHNNERQRLAFDYTYYRDSTLENFIDNTGRLDVRTRRNEKYVYKPTWTYQLNERVVLNVSATHTVYDFEENDTINTDYKIDTLSGALQYQWSQPVSLSLSAYSSDYKQSTALTGTTIKYEGYNFGFTYNYDETTNIVASLGQQYASSQQSVTTFGVTTQEDTKSKTDLYNLQINTESELTNYGASYSSQVVEDSQGNLNNRDEINFNVSHRLSELESLGLSGRYFTQEVISNAHDENDRVFWSISPAYIYQYSRKTRMKFIYTHMESKYRSNSEAAYSDEFMFILEYNLDKVSF